MGERKAKQESVWVMTEKIAQSERHPFYRKVNEVLERHKPATGASVAEILQAGVRTSQPTLVRLLGEEGLLEGQTIAIDATTLEANAAMRSIRRRDDGRRYEEYLNDPARAEGLEHPMREQLAHLDRKRKQEGVEPGVNEPGRSRCADHQDEVWPGPPGAQSRHAVDLSSGAVVAVTLQAADCGDTTTIQQTLKEAQVNAALVNERGVEDRG